MPNPKLTAKLLSALMYDEIYGQSNGDTETPQPPVQIDTTMQQLLEELEEKKQKERDQHALRVLIDTFLAKQGYCRSYGPRSDWVRDNRKSLAAMIPMMEEDGVEAFFARYPMIDCGKCEMCVGGHTQGRDEDIGQEATPSKDM